MGAVPSTAFPHRPDLIAEISGEFNSNGIFVSDWYDSTDFDCARIAAYGLPGAVSAFQVQEAQFSVNTTGNAPEVVRVQELISEFADEALYAQVPLTGRFFQITVVDGTPEGPVIMTVRGIK